MNTIQWLIARASHCWQGGKDIPLRLHIELQNAGIDVGKLRKEFVKEVIGKLNEDRDWM